MSDYGNLMEENNRLKAEVERLKAELAEAKKSAPFSDGGAQMFTEGADADQAAGTLTGQPVDTHTHTHSHE